MAAPWSTFDLTLADGSGIPIEERSEEEMRGLPNGQCASFLRMRRPPEVPGVLVMPAIVRTPPAPLIFAEIGSFLCSPGRACARCPLLVMIGSLI